MLDFAYVEFNNNKHAKGFKDINLAWIDHLFGVEAIDLKYLDNPKVEIINKGGFIFIAEHNGQVVGTCAMIKMTTPGFDFELAKMGVDKNYRGKGIGRGLAIACLQKAKKLGAKKIYLESNSKLVPALKLYKSLGFEDTLDVPSPYCRCDVQLQLEL